MKWKGKKWTRREKKLHKGESQKELQKSKRVYYESGGKIISEDANGENVVVQDSQSDILKDSKIEEEDGKVELESSEEDQSGFMNFLRKSFNKPLGLSTRNPGDERVLQEIERRKQLAKRIVYEQKLAESLSQKQTEEKQSREEKQIITSGDEVQETLAIPIVENQVAPVSDDNPTLEENDPTLTSSNNDPVAHVIDVVEQESTDQHRDKPSENQKDELPK
eukprot:TRINITY_DN856_c0_g1_i11.p2 TRINITY_DN856_c0_g1~~TRINITY_DN856_c0_g1_i11.p2  ORF type:complete len:221 (-),score=56.51 TRINITY_DN856_c0_g1_i11:61-723(-)